MHSGQSNNFENRHSNLFRPRRPIHSHVTQLSKLNISNQKNIKRPSVYGLKEGDTTEGRNWRETFCLLADRFGDQTSLHGFDYILKRRTGRIERIFWIFGFLVALYLLIGMYSILTERYYRKQFQTVVDETVYPTYKMPFPEIIVCNENRLNWARLDEAMNRFIKPEHNTEELRNLFIKIINSYDELTIYRLFILEWLESDLLETLNYINFTNIVTFMAWRCDEILVDCRWREKKYNCCDIFFPRRTNMGQCLSFNSLMTPEGKKKQATDPYWPWHTNGFGRGKGLYLRVLLREELHSPFSNNYKGVMFMITEPIIYSDLHYFLAKANHSAYATIGGSYIYYDNFTRSVSSSERDCVFDDEKTSEHFQTLQGLSYNYENCLYECQQRHIYEACGCTMDLFYPPSSYRVCQVVDMPCLGRHWKNFTSFEAKGEAEFLKFTKFSQMSCNCLFSCYSLEYKTILHTDPIYSSRFLESGSYVELDLSWRRNYMITYKTSMVFTWLDLLVSFGGIASLFLGISFISIVEFIYFLFSDMPLFIWRKCRSNRRLKELSRNNSVKDLLDYDSKH